MLRCVALMASAAAAAAQEPRVPVPTPVPAANVTRYHCDGNCDCITGPCPDNCQCVVTTDGTGHHTMKKCLDACVPRPITCPQELYRACGDKIGDQAGCKACAQADEANLTAANCTPTEPDSFCAIPSVQCAEVLALSCGKLAGNPAPCQACVQQQAANLTAAGCEQATTDLFCSVQLPPAATCAESLLSNCYDSVGTKCLACELAHWQALNAANCSELYKTAFCAIPKPACVEALMLNCALTEGDADACKACEQANADGLTECSKVNLAEFCTLAGELPALPPLPPGPSGCAYALAKADCAKHVGKPDCAACEAANKPALDAANCTATELTDFCDIPGLKCSEQLVLLCGTSIGDVGTCSTCVTGNAAALTAAGCTADQEQVFCTKGAPLYHCADQKCVATGNATGVDLATCQSMCG